MMKSTQKLRQPFISTLHHAIRPACRTPHPICRSTAYKVSHNSSLSRLLSRHPRRTPVQRIIKRFTSTASPTNPNAPPSPSLTQRMRKLSREYGWAAVGVYFLLSALDFPFCFLAVRWLGTERIGHWEHVALEWFWKVVPYPFPTRADNKLGESETSDTTETSIMRIDHGVKEAVKLNQGENASMSTPFQLLSLSLSHLAQHEPNFPLFPT